MMRGRLVIVAAVIATLAGFVFLRGPTPDIKVKPETLTSFGIVNVTNTMITSWIVVAFIVVAVFLATRRWELVPRGVQNLLEAIIDAFYNLVVNVAGEKNGRRFFPVVATIFFFVLVANWLSLLPIFNVIGMGKAEDHGFVQEQVDVGPLPVTFVPLSSLDQLKGRSIDEEDPQAEEKAAQERGEGNFVGEILPLFRGVNTDLNTPLALAIVSAIAVESWGIASLGFRTYGAKFFNVGRLLRGLVRFKLGEVFQGGIDAFVGFLEFVSEAVRLVSFTFRLFGNMFAGEILILVFTFIVPLIFVLPFYFLELFVGVIQAFIFAMLTLVFGVMAVTHAESHTAEPVPAATSE